MSVGASIFLGVLLLASIYAVTLYNELVLLKNNAAKAWANIDVLLKQRHDELPKLIEVCKQYKQFEQATLVQVITARNQVHEASETQNLAALGKAEGALRNGLGRLFAVAEAYPELRANESFNQLQGRISQLENGIADRREFYNDTVNINNTRVEQFPNTVIAGLFRFGELPLLEFSSAETTDVDVNKLFT